MSPEVLSWLDSVQCTKPLTLADARELKAALNSAVPGALVDVYWTRGDRMHVRVEAAGKIYMRSFDAV